MRRIQHWVAASFNVLVACASPPAAHPVPTSDAGSPLSDAAAVSHEAPDVASVSDTKWIEDDYPKALAEARAKKAPLFVDASAAWCHTCKAMRAFVLDDPTLSRSKLVWLSFDVEKEANAAVAKKLPASVLPTFFVIDPDDETVHGRWEGAGSVQQMRALLEDAARSIELAHAGSLAPDDPLALLLAGHRAEMKQEHDAAAKSFEAAIARAPKDWQRLPDALLALIVAERRAQKNDACLALALAVLPTEKLGRTSVLSDFADTALACAKRGDPNLAEKTRALAQKKLYEVATDPSAPMSADDRGDALIMVWEARDALGDHPGALEAAKTRLALLEKAAKAAPTPSIAEAFDGARMETLEFLGRPADAIGFLREHETELPDEYNPSRRLAHVYSALGRWDDALAAVERAIQRSWGATKAQMLGRKADILLKLGRAADAKAAVKEQVTLYGSLPEGQKKPELEKAAADRLSKM